MHLNQGKQRRNEQKWIKNIHCEHNMGLLFDAESTQEVDCHEETVQVGKVNPQSIDTVDGHSSF